MNRYQDLTRGDVFKTGIAILGFIVLEVGGALFFLPNYWYMWIVLVIGGLAMLITWHTTYFGYRCPHCGHTFAISVLRNLISPHGIGRHGGWKYLTCPQCHCRARMSLLKRIAS